jgi:hypothetical protein
MAWLAAPIRMTGCVGNRPADENQHYRDGANQAESETSTEEGTNQSPDFTRLHRPASEPAQIPDPLNKDESSVEESDRQNQKGQNPETQCGGVDAIEKKYECNKAHRSSP